MLTQQEANNLIQALKEAIRNDVFVWENDQSQEEMLKTVQLGEVYFVLNLKRNPFEIRLHFRTREQNIGLLRLDAAAYHPNPDGSELRNTPHLHIYQEGLELKTARSVDWYDVNSPMKTLERFLEEIHGTFPNGYQLALV